MRYRSARPVGTRARWLNALYECDFTKRSGKNVRFVRFYPPPLDYYTKENVFFALAEAVAAGRRPGSATGPARPDACTTDIIPHSCYGVRPDLSQGCGPKWG